MSVMLINLKKTLLPLFMDGGGSTAKKLEPLRGGRYMNEKESERNIWVIKVMSDKSHMNMWVLKVIESDSEK